MLCGKPDPVAMHALVAAFPHLRLSWVADQTELRSVLDDARRLRMTEVLRAALAARVRDEPMTRRALGKLAAVPLLSLPDAVEAADHGEQVMPRTVGALADKLGVGPRYLQREASRAGIHLGTTVRWFVLVHALGASGHDADSWNLVALRLGFSDHSALAHRCERVAAATLSELAGRPWRETLASARDACVRAAE